jgi:hemoglobin/transferrin/lactoferrin receptor protein
MKKCLFISAITLYSSLLFSQIITVVDKTTRQTIPGVIIYSNNPKVSTTTNAKGQADIFAFRGADSIYFSHINYNNAHVLKYAQIEFMQFIIELTETYISLNEVIVTVNRWEEEQIEIPYRVEKINLKEISFQNPQTSADLLGTTGFAYIQKSQLSGGSPSLRGFATNRVMLVIDGIRMNNAIFRTGNIQNVVSIDAYSLESTEILFGPGAVMYGSDAIGGVMDFHTLQPVLSDSTENLSITGNTFVRYASASSEKTGHFDFNIGLKKLAFITSLTYSDYDDLRTGSRGNSYFLRPSYQKTINGADYQFINSDPHLQVNSGYSQMNMMQKISFKPYKSWELDYGLYYSVTSDAPRYDRLYLDANSDGKLDYADWHYGPQKWLMNRLGITNSQPNKLYDQFRFVAALQNYKESRHDRKFNNTYLRNQTEKVNAFSINLDMEKKIGNKISFFYGTEAVINSIGSVANREQIFTGAKAPTTTRYPNGSIWQAYGVFANLKYHLRPNWIINSGLRYSFYRIKADFDTTMFPFPFTHANNNNGAMNGSLGCVYTPFKTWQIYINGSTGFRAPNIDDIGKVFSSEPGSVVVPNADLSPEYAYNAEIGTALTIRNYLKIDFALYYTLLDHALARRNFQYNGHDSIIYDGEMSQVQAIQNISKAYVYGIQAGVDVSFGMGFGLKTTICYQKGQEQSEDSLIYYPISHIAPVFGSTHLTYERKKLKLDLYALYNGKMEFENLPLSERNDNTPYAKNSEGFPFVPGWYTLNLKAGLYLNKYLAINFGVENITDNLYRSFGSGISAPGRNFIAAIKCKF